MTFMLPLLFSPAALAAPSHPLVRRSAGPAAIAIWIPIIGVAIIAAVGISIAVYMRKQSSPRARPREQNITRQTLGTRLRAWSSRPVMLPGAQTRELTAEQLAGMTGSGRNRRRRLGSMASQRSTRSLPLYMKEPGEQEVVVFRGHDELADDLPGNGMLPPVEEGHEQNSIEMRRTSTTSLDPANTPLLEDQEREGTPSPDPPAPPRIRSSSETLGGNSSEEPLMERERGPAPPYMEAVSIDSGVAFNESTTQNDVSSPSIYLSHPAPAESASSSLRSQHYRRPGLLGRAETSVSGLLSLFNPNSQRANGNANANGETETPLTSVISSPASGGEQPARQRTRPRGATVAGLISPTSPVAPPYRTHRPSNSGSTLSTIFRTGSNTSAADRLASPSMLSLHSISAPLTHTVIRTEYTYPRTGPTPEQMKLIASVDSFKRFGVPYGPDAVAYAASTSRLDLRPPPMFEEIVRTSSHESESGSGLDSTPEAASGSDPAQDSPLASHNTPSPLSQAQPTAAAADESESTSSAAEPTQEVQGDTEQSPQTESPTVQQPLTAEDVKRILHNIVPSTSFKGTASLSPISPSSHATAEEPDTASPPSKPAITVIVESAPPASTDASSPSTATPRAVRRHTYDNPDATTGTILVASRDGVSPIAEHPTEALAL